jgi:dynein heavy chain
MNLNEFKDVQSQLLKELEKKLDYFRGLVKKEINKACMQSYNNYKAAKNITIEDNAEVDVGKKKRDNIISFDQDKVKSEEELNKKIFQSLLKDNMPYAQDASRRTHYKKLLRFIRVADFIFNEAKFEMINNSLDRLSQRFTRLYTCVKENWIDIPILSCYIQPQLNMLKYNPHSEIIRKAILEDYIAEKIYIVIFRKSFIDPQEFPNYMSCFEEVFETTVDQNSNLNIRIKEDNRINSYFKNIKSNIDLCFNFLENYATELLPIYHNFNYYNSIDFNQLSINSTPDELKDLLSKFILELGKIKKLKEQKFAGVFEINLSNLLRDIQEAPGKWISSMRELIPKVLMNKTREITIVLNNNLKRLSVMPSDVETFINLKLAVEDISNHRDEIDHKNTEIKVLENIIKEDRDIQIPDYDVKTIREKDNAFIAYEKKLESMVYFRENNMMRYKKELKDNIMKFDGQVKIIAADLNSDVLNNYSEDNFSAILFLDELKSELRKLIEKRAYFKQQEKDMEVEEGFSYENLANLEYDYELKSKLWNSVREFQELSRNWLTAQVLQIELIEMEEVLKKWIEIAKTSLVDLDSQVVPKILLEKTYRFHRILPALKAFQNENVLADNKFIDMIKKALDIDIELQNNALTLEYLLENNSIQIDETLTEISRISYQANEENKLLDQFHDILQNYNEHRIQTRRYARPELNKQQSEGVLLRDVDKEYEFVEENLTKLNILMLNEYFGIIEKDSNVLVANFNKYLNVLGEFSNYSRFLAISDKLVFENPEFQKDNLSEFKKINNETTYKTIMKLLKENYLLPKYIDNAHERIFNDLRKANRAYEEYMKFIEDYLNKKRKDNLKFFFLTNEEIFDVFSNFENNDMKVKYGPKLMNHIKSVEISGDTEYSLKLTSDDDEIINMKYQKGKNTIKEMLDAVDNEIAKRLKVSFRSFKKECAVLKDADNQKTIEDILLEFIKNKDNLGQSVFNMFYSYYIEVYEKALASDDVFDKVIDIKMISKPRKHLFIDLIRKNGTEGFYNYSPVEVKILLNMITLENYFNDILGMLIREDVNSVNDFNWQKILNLKIDGEQCLIKIFNFTSDYGYEYVGIHNNLIITPSVEKLYITISNCFFLKKPFVLYGLPDSGKKEVLKMLSIFFGKAISKFKCTEQFDYKAFSKILFGLQKNGSWLSLENLELVEMKALSIIAEEVLSVYRQLADPKCEFLHIAGDKIQITKRDTQIFLLSNANIKYDNMPRNIKFNYRMIGCHVPDVELFTHKCLKNIAFPTSKYYSKKLVYLFNFINVKVNKLHQRLGLSLFSQVIKRLEADMKYFTHENVDEYVKKAFLKTFSAWMSEEEYIIVEKQLNQVLMIGTEAAIEEPIKTNTNSKLSEKPLEPIDIMINEITDSFHFIDNNYKHCVKSLINSFNNTEYFILTGPSLSGKSTSLKLLSKYLEEKNKREENSPLAKIVSIFPKAYNSKHLFSENERSALQQTNIFLYNQLKLIWEKEALVRQEEETLENETINKVAEVEAKKDFIKIVHFDGQIDATWIDHFNVMWDRKGIRYLHLPNGDKLDLTTYKIFFEVDNLQHASPAFIAKNKIFAFNSQMINWENTLFNWLANSPKANINSELKNYIRGLFENYYPKIYEFIERNKLQCIGFNENIVLKDLILLFDSILPFYDFSEKKIGRKNTNRVTRIDVIKRSTISIFIFSCAWTAFNYTNYILKTKIEKLITDSFKADDLKGPIFEYFINDEYEFQLWSDLLPQELKIDSSLPYGNMFIETVDNIPYQWILTKYIRAGIPVFYSGKPEIGKSLLIRSLINQLDNKAAEVMSLSYLVNHNSTFEGIERFLLDNLSFIKRDLIGDVHDRRIAFYIEDCNIQRHDEFASQTCVEYLRMLINNNYIYDMKTNTAKRVNKLSLVASANISCFEKNALLERFIHQCAFISQNSMADESNQYIFKTVLESHLIQFIPNTSAITAAQYVQATLNLVSDLNNKFKPGINTLHHRFTFSDIWKILQGIHDFKYTGDNTQYQKFLIKSWFFETTRVFEDKFNKQSDKLVFRKSLQDAYFGIFKTEVKYDDIINEKNNFLYTVNSLNQKGRRDITLAEYNYIENTEEIFKFLEERLALYYKNTKHRQIWLLPTISKLILNIIRILMAKKSHLILLGQNLRGKHSLVNFTNFILERKYIELDDIFLQKDKAYRDKFFKKLLIDASYGNEKMTIYCSNRILENEELLEVISHIMNIRGINQSFGKLRVDGVEPLKEEEIINRIETNLHFVLCLRPKTKAYHYIYHNYLYIGKQSSVIHLDKVNQETYLDINTCFVDKDINTLSEEKLGKDYLNELIYEIHNNIKSLAHEYSYKTNSKIVISTKNYLDMLMYYFNNHKFLSDILYTQKNRLQYTVNTGLRLEEARTKMDIELFNLDPQREENDRVLDDIRSELNRGLSNKSNIILQKAEEDKQLNQYNNNKKALLEQIDELLQECVDKVADAVKFLNRVEKNELFEFRNVIEAHSLSKNLLGYVYTLVGEDPSWETLKRNLDPKYIRTATSIDYKQCPSVLVKAVKEVLSTPDFPPENVPKTMIICKYISDWFVALDRYYTEREKYKEFFKSVEDLESKIKTLEKANQSTVEQLKEITNQISILEKNINDTERVKSKIGTQIRNRLDLKEMCDDLETAINEKQEYWQKKLENVNKVIDSKEFYILFLSFYIFYAGAFNFTYRNKIKDIFSKKAEEQGIYVRKLDFVSVAQDFFDMKNDKEFSMATNMFNEYTLENFFILHLSKKIGCLVDPYKTCDSYLAEYNEKKDQRRVLTVKQKDSDLLETIERCMKEGYVLVIQEIDENIYGLIKNILREEKIYANGKNSIEVDFSLKEYNDKLKLYLVKNVTKGELHERLWLESTVINFTAKTSQLEDQIIKELLLIDDAAAWESYGKTKLDLFREQTRRMESEDKAHSFLADFDYSGNIDKNTSNTKLIERIKNEYSHHTILLDNIKNQNNKLQVFKNESTKYKTLANFAAKVFKLLCRFMHVDNVYNFGFSNYIQYIRAYYANKIISDENYKFKKEDMFDFIMFIYSKISNIYRTEERKILLSVMLFYYQASSEGNVPKSFYKILADIKRLLFSKAVKSEQLSPCKFITQHQWNALLQLSNDYNGIMGNIINDISNNLSDWNDYLDDGNNYSFKFINEELEAKITSFEKVVFFTIIKPYKLYQLLDFYLHTVLGDEGFKKIKVTATNIRRILSCSPPNKPITIIDQSTKSEREVVLYAVKRPIDTYEKIVIESELSTQLLEKIALSMKNGIIILIRNIHLAKDSIVKLFDQLNDDKLPKSEHFRLVILVESNVLLPSIVFERTQIINNGSSLYPNMKNNIEDLVNHIDSAQLDFILNRKFNNIYCRKIFFHLILAHSVLIEYQNFKNGILQLPYVLTNKDFLNCFYFICNYLKELPEREEITYTNPNSESNNNYLTLMNIALETFYANRSIYKEENNRVIKIFQKFFEEEKFNNTDFYFNFGEKGLAEFEIHNDKRESFTLDNIIELFDNIPLEHYYEMLIHIYPELIKSNLQGFSEYFFDLFENIVGKQIVEEKMKKEKLTMDGFVAKISEIREKLPLPINISEEAGIAVFKLNKQGEYVNPLDESLKHEIEAYNKYLALIKHKLDVLDSTVKGQYLITNKFIAKIMSISKGQITDDFINGHINLTTRNIDEWLNVLNKRLSILREWLAHGQLGVYPADLFYNFKLFMLCQTINLARRFELTPDQVKLSVYFSSESDIDYNTTFICSGFIMDNASFDVEMDRIVTDISGNVKCPLIAISIDLSEPVKKEDDEEEEEENQLDKEIDIPIYDGDFENKDHVLSMKLRFDIRFREEYWISKAIRIRVEN